MRNLGLKLTLLLAFISSTPLNSSAQEAQFLCVTKKNAIVTRSACRKGEKKLNVANIGNYGLKGDQGAQGPVGASGPTGLGRSDILSSGQTITGFAGNTFFPGSTGASTGIYVDFGVQAPMAVPDERVVVKANAALISACGSDACLSSSDRDAGVQAMCTGTSEAPTAPPGYVCIYPLALLDVASNLQGAAVLNSKYGFQIFWIVGNQNKSVFIGTWAYTAP